MAVNKVEVDGEIKLDLTEDTVTPETLLKGATAHNAAGEDITGTLEAGGGGVAESDITFYDYEGTIVESWTLAELANKTALPAYPSHEGLICQGWNWSLADLKSTNRKMNVGAMYITDDGKTRIYIHLEEGRTSPMLGVCPNGTVTVDWGDGTTPDTLTGTSTSTAKWTPNHNYAAPGDYVIKLTVDGTFGFAPIMTPAAGSAVLKYAAGIDNRNTVYQSSVLKIEIGAHVTAIGASAFRNCQNLKSITIPDYLGDISNSAFFECRSLLSVTIPNGVSNITPSLFYSCTALVSVTLPATVASIVASTFNGCYSLSRVTIPDGAPSIGASVFSGCMALASVEIPNSVTSIGSSSFSGCRSLRNLKISVGITSIGAYAFNGCYGVAFYDFSTHTAVPTLANTNAFTGIAADCEIRVPAALVDEWKAATNWATYADYIVGV